MGEILKQGECLDNRLSVYCPTFLILTTALLFEVVHLVRSFEIGKQCRFLSRGFLPWCAQSLFWTGYTNSCYLVFVCFFAGSSIDRKCLETLCNNATLGCFEVKISSYEFIGRFMVKIYTLGSSFNHFFILFMNMLIEGFGAGSWTPNLSINIFMNSIALKPLAKM